MPKVVNIAPKDIYVTVEFNITELQLLKEGLELARIEYDGNSENDPKAAKYIEEFYKFLEDFLREVKRNGT